LARRRSKWRKTTVLMKKLMQEARKARARESLKQCPVCGSPYTLSITIKEDKWTGIKTATVTCSACGFSVTLENLPPIADEFWVYSRVLDSVRSSTAGGESLGGGVAEGSGSESGEKPEEKEEGAEIEFIEVQE